MKFKRNVAVKTMRQRMGLNQADFGDLHGLSKSSIGKIERGATTKVRDSILKQLKRFKGK